MIESTANAVREINNADVARRFDSYPGDIRQKLLELRRLILDVAYELPDVAELEETLKWGEPSYLTKGGSTIRIGWKASRPEHYAMYLNCNTKLIDTFRQIYADKLIFEGNRAIIFHQADKVPRDALKHCTEMALRYHEIKRLPLLGS